ncbi:MAG: ATP-binding cassette domain-containing protein [Chitinivibrionales bacterium]|nr:ATP-binding cassette domain-containing protein [Chitinivibrionales bacterium]
MNRAILATENLTAGYDDCPVLHTVELMVGAQERWAVIGRNGAGKSTLIKSLAALLSPISGSVLLHDKALREYTAQQRAREMAYVPQKPEVHIPYTVYDFVLLGRYANTGFFRIPGSRDRQAVAQAMELCDIGSFCERTMTSLSGGEMQRVMLAGALAQEAPVLLLDEPTTHLDPAHERFFFSALRSAQDTKELTIVMVTHDINTALSSCTHVLALLDGCVHFAGTATEFRKGCPEELNRLYGVKFDSYTMENGTGNVFGTWEMKK